MSSGYPEQEEKIKKTLEVLPQEFVTIRAGRASSAVLDRVAVDYYGAPTPIQQIASVNSPDPRSLVIQPWDAAMLKHIEKAIQSSDLGINPTNDGSVIRLVFPQLTEERRRELTKTVHKYAEACKVAIRNVRRDALEKAKDQKKKSELTEDDLKDIERDMQVLIEKSCKDVDAMALKKEKELMEV